MNFIKWREFFRVEQNKMVLFKITPHQSVSNNTNRKLWRTLHKMYEMYDSIPSRVERNGTHFIYREKDMICFDIVFKTIDGKQMIEFYVATTELWSSKFKSITEERMKVQVEEVPIDEVHIPQDDTVIYELKYNLHDIHSLKTDATEQTSPIGSVLTSIHDIEEGDMARISVISETVGRRKWSQLSSYAHDKLKKGVILKRARISTNDIVQSLQSGVISLFNEVSSIISDTIHAIEKTFFSQTDKKQNKMEIQKISHEEIHLSQRSRDKRYSPVWKTRIRVAVHSPNDLRRDLIANSLCSAYSEIGEDNDLIGLKVRMKPRIKAAIDELNTFQLSNFTRTDGDINIMSCDELAKVSLQLPTAEIQRKYEEELCVNRSIETTVPAALSKGKGIKIGHVEIKGEKKDIHIPVGNFDELCLPHIVIGAMGSGKTKGFGANWMVQSVLNGYGALAIDPAKGEIGDEVEAALPKDKVVRIRLGEKPFSLDFCEVAHSPRAKNRLANSIISFFNTAADEAGGQTARYIRAAVIAMRTGKLAEIMNIFEDEEYLSEVILDMKDSIHKSTLQSFAKESDARKRQIISPIYNRLDTILGDEYLAECLESDSSIDMVDLMSQRKAIIIDVPKSVLGPEGVDLIVNLLSVKIDLAMTLRKEEDQFPFSVIFDEPHQFLRSASTWKAAAVESRKWGIKYIWMFHSWEQIPRDLSEIIKAAGPHYTLYPSSKKTFQDLREEISPFTLEEAMSLKRFHAINVIRSGGEIVTPFIAKMSGPPSGH